LGEEIMELDSNPFFWDRKPYGASLLRYLAALGDDGDAATDPCALEADYRKNCGNYFFAQEGNDLGRIFQLLHLRLHELIAS
jgi:hypothetical protein